MRKTILVAATIFLSACGKPSDGTQTSADSLPDKVSCKVYDSCSYSGGLLSTAIYDCVETTYQAADHPEIDPSYFDGNTCLTTKEDHHYIQSFCGPMNQYTCISLVRGPGPLAIPAIGI